MSSSCQVGEHLKLELFREIVFSVRLGFGIFSTSFKKLFFYLMPPFGYWISFLFIFTPSQRFLGMIQWSSTGPLVQNSQGTLRIYLTSAMCYNYKFQSKYIFWVTSLCHCFSRNANVMYLTCKWSEINIMHEACIPSQK